MEREIKTIAIEDFIARWSEIVDDLGNGASSGVDVTRDGEVVAIVRPPRRSLHGAMRGSVLIPDGFDLTAPAFDEAAHAEDGRLHE